MLGSVTGLGVHIYKEMYNTKVDRILAGMVISNGLHINVLSIENKKDLVEFAARLDERRSFQDGSLYLESRNRWLYVSVPGSVNSYYINKRLRGELMRYSKGE